jgi:hypothetical protein
VGGAVTTCRPDRDAVHDDLPAPCCYGPTCPVCAGHGLTTKGQHYCPACGGEGDVPLPVSEACGPEPMECEDCDGTGRTGYAYACGCDHGMVGYQTPVAGYRRPDTCRRFEPPYWIEAERRASCKSKPAACEGTR